MTKRQREYWSVIAEADKMKICLSKLEKLSDGAVEQLKLDLQTKKAEKASKSKTLEAEVAKDGDGND